MRLKTLTLIILLAGSSAIGLTGCKKLSDAAQQAQSRAGVGEASADAKFNAYIGAYNSLIGTFGLTEIEKTYRAANIAKKSPNDSFNVSDGWIEKDRDKLKEARAMSGNVPPALDAAADRLIAALDKVVTRINGLNVYYDSKAYIEDKLARGKQEDPLMLADFDAADSALDAFNTVLEQEAAKRDQAELARLKDGDPLLYQTKLALNQAKAFVNLFNKPDDIANPALLKQADAKIAELEQTLATQRTLREKANTDGKSPSVEYRLIDSNLTDMIGAYRSMKQSRSGGGFESVVRDYNDAVRQGNDIRD